VEQANSLKSDRSQMQAIVKFYSNEMLRRDCVPLKQQISIEKQFYRFAALVQNRDRGR
jgi:hypothetical protein